MYKYVIIVGLLIFLIIIYCGLNKSQDMFVPYVGNGNNIGYYQIWNQPLRSTRNMSYDLRGDVPIPYYINMPWNMSERMPIQNRTLSDIS